MIACQVGRCRRRPATPIPACGTVYVCDDCRALIERLTAERAEDAR